MKYLQLMVASLIAIEFCAFVSSVDLQSSIYSDPGRYYAKSNQQKQRRRLKNKVGYLFWNLIIFSILSGRFHNETFLGLEYISRGSYWRAYSK